MAARLTSTDQNGAVWSHIGPEQVRGYLATHTPIWVGYREALRGDPLDPFAYAGDHGGVIRYEEGRKFCALCIGAGISPPAWDDPAWPPRELVSVVVAFIEGGS